MEINGIDVRLYSDGHDDSVLYGVQQFLDAFECCDELRTAVETIIAENTETARLTAVERREIARVQKQKIDEEFLKREMMTDEDEEFPGEPEPLPIVGLCPRCGMPVGGGFFQNCETRRSGRMIFKECTKCSYYSELFMRGSDVYEEIEGG